MTPAIQMMTTDEAIAACYPVMRELRPHLAESEFVSRVRQLASAGYRLAALHEDHDVVAVAGFRISENLAWGRFLYVDDLVTRAACRSRGYGAMLLAWLKAYAASAGCQQLHLDSGVWRTEAHRFYQREGMEMRSLHFACEV